jgi:hypothetical protein
LYKKVWACDSFKGIPPVKTDKYPADAAHVGADKLEILNNNSKKNVWVCICQVLPFFNKPKVSNPKNTLVELSSLWF